MVFFGANDAAFPMPSGQGQYVPLPEFEENLCRIATYLQVPSLSLHLLPFAVPI